MRFRWDLAAPAFALAAAVSGSARAQSGDPLAADREACDAAAVQGRKSEALEACARAYTRNPSSEIGEALVRARLAGSELPGVYDLAAALLLARELRAKDPRSPWGYAAMCDVAEQIGDRVMLQQCFDDLTHVAPGHPATLRAAAAVRASQPSWWVAAGWLAIALGALAAFGSAALRALTRRRAGSPRTAAALVAVCASLGYAGMASAEPSADHKGISNFPIDDSDPVKSIPTLEQRSKQPVEFGYWLMDLAEKATKASKAGDHEASVRYFTAMSIAVPDRPVSFVHLCDEYEALGDRAKAIEACHTALFLPPLTSSNFVRYLQLAVSKPAPLSSDDVAQISDVIQHLRDDASGGMLADDWECQLAVRLGNTALLEKCSRALMAAAPDASNTIVYQWTLALMRNDLAEAHRVSAHAKQTPMAPSIIERFDRDTGALEQEHHRRAWVLTGSGFLGFIALGALVLWLRQRRQERTAADLPPPPAIATTA